MSKKRRILCLVLIVLGLTAVFAFVSWASYTKAEKAIARISPEEARQLVESGQALLVCSYGDDTCKSRLLEGALLRSELEGRLSSLSKDQKIIFYCG